MAWTHETSLSRHRLRLIAVLLLVLLCVVYLLAPLSGQTRHEPILSYGTPDVRPSETPLQAGAAALYPLPAVYGAEVNETEHTEVCSHRYGASYLRAFSDTATSYCDESSTARLFCFSAQASDDRTDSFCIGDAAIYDPSLGSFGLDCVMREWTDKEKAAKTPKFIRFARYWYDTGPHAIFDHFFRFGRDAQPEVVSKSATERVSLLIKREDNNQNMWHRMMEIMSLTMSLDVLRTTLDPTTSKPFFTDKDMANSQIVFVDDLPKEPFDGLWEMSTGLPSVHLKLNSTKVAELSKVVVPLPGGSNPFWQGDWNIIDCGQSSLLKAFSSRVIDFYKIPSTLPPAGMPLNLTFIDRKSKRRLLHKKEYFEEVRKRYPDIYIRVVDYASLSFAEQVKVSHSTNILVGVHGAGLTHGMFLPPNSSIVEILPPELMHKGFENTARFLGHRHFSAHSEKHVSANDTGDWQHDDVYLDKAQFMTLIDGAIAGAKG